MRPVHPEVPLKKMDASLLSLELYDTARRVVPYDDLDRVIAAATTASHLHRGQTRSVREDVPVVPYIEHPLRNTLRLMRWGSTDPDLLCASLLHDVPEDCADRAVQVYANSVPGRDATEQTLAWIGDNFGSRVASTVRAVTNPERPAGMSDAARLAQYVEHVTHAVRGDSHALLVKASDLTDNAGSLPHQTAGVAPEVIAKRVSKYTPVVETVHQELLRAGQTQAIDPDLAANAISATNGLRRTLAQMPTRAASFPSSTPHDGLNQQPLTSPASQPSRARAQRASLGR